MELGNQIKQRRQALGLSQEALAERVYVSRQSISNWETGKTYPDIHSLLLLSGLFGVSLDQLVKGDIEVMKAAINKEDIRHFRLESMIFFWLLAATILAAFPLIYFLGLAGILVWAAIWGAAMVLAVRIEREKKRFDIQTYREIAAFLEGKRLDEIEAARESGKRIYQKIMATLLVALVTAAVTALMYLLLT